MAGQLIRVIECVIVSRCEWSGAAIWISGSDRRCILTQFYTGLRIENIAVRIFAHQIANLPDFDMRSPVLIPLI